uniref:Erythropoietin n=1 Tax=Callorhinchus milii TaxID=7868 RepID=A0A4W3HVH5_CALMI|eukprot:gi/632968519/ref/XP_007900571.1/ PREDICTED: thrombopoietin isoform X1 [Callorhinchus milii]
MSGANGQEKDRAKLGMDSRLLLLVAFLVQTKLARMLPSRPLCDSRVLDRYIREAKGLQNSVCYGLCQFPDAILLPSTGLNLRAWRSKSRSIKATEIKEGLIMLSNAIQTAKLLTMNNSTVALLDKIYRNIRTFIHILQLLNVPDTSHQLYERARPITGRSVRDLFRTYTRLLQGKVYMFYRELAEENCTQRKR